MRILLVEPAYKNKYPPLGLMKIAAFHKGKKHEVKFAKGLDKTIRAEMWDRIYITTLFSFYWSQTVSTIKYYEFSVKDPQNLFIGGPMATIMAEEIENETGYKTVKGLLNEKVKLRIKGDEKIDGIVPDYSILDDIAYKYPAQDAYFTYMTRGCIRSCPFCAVPKIEPEYNSYIPIRKQIKIINQRYGEKKDLLLLDNNILASPMFDHIIDEIQEIGFYRGAKLNNKNRHVDFNQGVDLRLLTKGKMKRLAELPIRPLRIAFDNIKYEKEYKEKVRLAAEYGIKHLSNYILYNFDDTPENLYNRLKINIELNEELGTKIFSFPMKYIPVKDIDRKYIDEKHWNRRYLRSIQCILNATHGVVGLKRQFFEAAFGKDLQEFKKLLLLPDKYLIYRYENLDKGTREWETIYNSLTNPEKEDFYAIVFENKFTEDTFSKYPRVNELLRHYFRNLGADLKDEHRQIA